MAVSCRFGWQILADADCPCNENICTAGDKATPCTQIISMLDQTYTCHTVKHQAALGRHIWRCMSLFGDVMLSLESALQSVSDILRDGHVHQ